MKDSTIGKKTANDIPKCKTEEKNNKKTKLPLNTMLKV